MYTEIDAAVINLIAAVQKIGGEAVFVVGDPRVRPAGRWAADAVKRLCTQAQTDRNRRSPPPYSVKLKVASL